MRIALDSFHGNPNVGLFVFATDDICLIPRGSTDGFKKRVKEILQVEVIETSIAGTSLIGVFCIGFGKTVFVPKITFDSEISYLKGKGLKIEVIDSDFTALGNNIILNKNTAVLSKDYDDSVSKQIENFGLKVFKKSVMGMNNIGSFILLNNHGGIVHPDIAEDEKAWLEHAFGIKFVHATVNLGSPYVSSGVVANDKGVIVGDRTKGMELSFIEEGLGVVKNEE